ncbi:hypothetical protein K3555_00235 [Leisingera sp. M527]|uniref:hypothetical protein n=1 Tax=unclassified Leisingera TaxID=2614906 RepID=UPI000A7D8CAC|nr:MULTISPECIES: hypothetical protein [unclassified Leisingera]MBQ4825701.1 hypothetical protein [Leisingera sp. HS039]QAX27975.1 hypothetical protein ETW24_00230 [Leisingera sp. NJS204]QBR37891.1 hypothetical protein ETW23_19060 [Leisingera sp. NJS201]UWQ28547.1 hypothetical protein K3557_17655 [Leisingera sp. M523]UWQ33003.1 hypothetical protein K3555_00235 [Leisingera sp. M527]
MTKAIAVINVIAWAGFWAFGYLALTAEGFTETQIVTASLLAASGLITGIIAYLRLVRGSERSGYAKPSNRITRAQRDAAQAQWGQIE